MARAGLGSGWECLFSNDFDRKKAGAYAANWGAERFCVGDIAAINAVDLPAQASLAWASFPCQDLSLAGNQAGLKGARSGTFWAFMGLVAELAAEGRAPKLIVLENVCGALTSHEGKDFAAIGEALADAGYHYGAVVIDAVLFVPQSRPRLFVIAARKDRRIDQRLAASGPSDLWHPANLLTAQSGLPVRAKAAWIWWNLPRIRPRRSKLADLIEDDPRGVAWHTASETRPVLAHCSVKRRTSFSCSEYAELPSNRPRSSICSSVTPATRPIFSW